MTNEPTNGELYNLINRLFKRIDTLERKIDRNNDKNVVDIDKIREKLGFGFPVSFESWTSSFSINSAVYHRLFIPFTGRMDSIKMLLSSTIEENNNIPLFKYNKTIYVYKLLDEEVCGWVKFCDDDLKLMIKLFWCKLMKYKMDNPEDEDDDVVSDHKRQVTLRTREYLYDVKTNKNILQKWLLEII